MHKTLLAGFAFLAFFPAAASAQSPDYNALALSVIEGQVIPGYQAFRDDAAQLDRALATYCAAPKGRDLGEVKAAYHQAFDAWQAVQYVTYGPVLGFNRGQRVQFWPDKKNAADRQLRLILRDRDEAMLDAAKFAFASVALQGFPALEYLVFEQAQAAALASAHEEGAFLCRFLTVISGNLAHIGTDLAKEWVAPNGARDQMAQAGQPDSPYVDSRAAASIQFNAMLTMLEALSELKLAYPLGASPEQARSIRAESWRSQRSLRNVAANLRAFRQAYGGGGDKGYAGALRAIGHSDLDTRMAQALGQSIIAADALGDSVTAVMDSPEGWRKLDGLKTQIKALHHMFGAEIGLALDMQLGFNGLDGD